jgi:hypothetical protein
VRTCVCVCVCVRVCGGVGGGLFERACCAATRTSSSCCLAAVPSVCYLWPKSVISVHAFCVRVYAVGGVRRASSTVSVTCGLFGRFSFRSHECMRWQVSLVLGDSETPGIELFVQLRLLLALEVRISAHFLARCLAFAAPILAEARVRAGAMGGRGRSGGASGVDGRGDTSSPLGGNRASNANSDASEGKEGESARDGVESGRTSAVVRYEFSVDTERVEVRTNSHFSRLSVTCFG